MKTLMLIIGSFIPLMFACHSDDDPKSLYHSPIGEVMVKLADTTILLDFSKDAYMNEEILSYQNSIIDKLKTREDLISYYKALIPSFLPAYLSTSNIPDHNFAKVEYLLAQECFQNDCSSKTRREVLTTAVEKQKNKFVTYVLSSRARRTGAFLIALNLLKEGDNSFYSISDK